MELKTYSNPKTKELKKFLLKGPVFSKTQIEVIKKNRQTINQWRNKS